MARERRLNCICELTLPECAGRFCPIDPEALTCAVEKALELAVKDRR